MEWIAVLLFIILVISMCIDSMNYSDTPENKEIKDFIKKNMKRYK